MSGTFDGTAPFEKIELGAPQAESKTLWDEHIDLASRHAKLQAMYDLNH